MQPGHVNAFAGRVVEAYEDICLGRRLHGFAVLKCDRNRQIQLLHTYPLQRQASLGKRFTGDVRKGVGRIHLKLH